MAALGRRVTAGETPRRRFPLTLEDTRGTPRRFVTAAPEPRPPTGPAPTSAPVPATLLERFGDGHGPRLRMVERLRSAGCRDEAVLLAMAEVPRHSFVDSGLLAQAYEDTSLPIGLGQTISKPSVVARMLSVLHEGSRARACGNLGRVLEIGTGCGYQAALMAELFGEVVSIERVRGLHDVARENLRPMRLANLRLMFGDGRLGAPQSAPFDAIIVAAAGDRIPDDLLTQMNLSARLLAPVGDGVRQALHLVERTAQQGWELTVLDAARFVPLRNGTI